MLSAACCRALPAGPCRRRSWPRPAEARRPRVCVGYQTDAAPPAVPIPASIEAISNGNILGFGADLAEDHPGFHDEAYKARRLEIARIASTHRPGQPIPRIDYTPEEVAVWGAALRRLRALFPAHACAEFNNALRDEFDFSEDEIPQLQDVSETLRAATGWQLRPVAGLMHPRDFLNGLAFKFFHSTQYIRHASKPDYTPEPDVIHELIGHAVMLRDPCYAELVRTIGVASLGATDKEIWHLTKVYWYSVEFGVVREPGSRGIKAFGSGILSSSGELEWMGQGRAELVPFDPWAPQPRMSYKDGFQARYFVMDGFQTGLEQLREYATAVRRVAA